MRLNTGFFITLFFASLLFTACNEKTDADGRTDDKDTTVTKEVTASSSDHLLMYYEGLHPADQVKFFNGLPSEMKHQLWSSHFKRALGRAENDEERAYIQEWIDRLKPEYYKDSSLYAKEGAPFVRSHGDKAYAIFKNDSPRVRELLYRIGGDLKAPRMIAEGGLPDCRCNVSDDWCWWGSTCTAGDCKESVAGCGRGGMEKCNGWCKDN